jgi:two-component system chemotaxis sensor kinase CheA
MHQKNFARESSNEVQEIIELRALLAAAQATAPSEEVLASIRSFIVQLHEIAKNEETKQAFATLMESYDSYVGSIGFDDLLGQMITDALNTFTEKEESAEAPSTEPTPAPSQEEASPATKSDTSPEQSPTPQKKMESGKSMRVSEEHIDTFLSHIGELFIVGELLSYLERKLLLEDVHNDVLKEYRSILESFSSLSHNLQHSVMSVRKVSVKSLIQKSPRLVRDIASERGKSIAVKLTGEEIEIDKSLIELLDAPLTHMVRNAADHGIEMPEDREAADKDPQGTVHVSVKEDDKFVTLEIIDDGRGLNYDAIQKKAESLGLIQPGRKLSEDDVVNFLFAAGVSTAEKVTDVSGRGVGMDVVKRAIVDAGGNIHVHSEVGKGSTFTIQVPKAVTTQILEGLIFEIGEQCFVIPLDRINEAFACVSEEFFSAAGEDRYIFRHEEMVPIVPAKKLLSLKPLSTEQDEDAREHIISVRANRRTMGVWVDGIVGVQQVVVKDLKHIGDSASIFVGGALMGDGRIALILDVDKLCEKYDVANLAAHGHSTQSEPTRKTERTDESSHEGTYCEVVIARVGNDRIAFPLSLVNRLEKFSSAEVERASGTPVVQYREGILPLYDLSDLFQQETSATSEQFHTVVFKDGENLAGFIVDEIFDIAEDEIEIHQMESSELIQGTAIIRDKVTTLLNLPEVLQQKSKGISATPL